jgi:mediator of RNA polymerase II transcription subunit 13
VYRDNDPPGSHEVSDDPVLQSYARCIEAELLSVWRRVPKRTNSDLPASSSGRPDDKNVLTHRRELWIFWYGDRPDDVLKKLVSPQLKEVPDVSGTWENVLPYEARTLLYKALNNLIERHV